MDINWVKDESGVAVLADIGIHVSDCVLPVDAINRKASAENRARKHHLDESRLDGIRSAYLRRIPVPKIVVRKDPRHGNVIVGGNHRFSSLNGEKSIPVHLIECTDAEFEMACKLLNTVVGDGISKEDRINAAIEAHLRLGVEKKDACKNFGISETSMKEAIKTREIQAKFAAMPAKSKEFVTLTHIRNLGDLAKNDNVLRAAMQAISTSKIPAKEVVDLAREARLQSTESGQVSVFERFTKMAETDADKVVPRRTRRAFLSSCTQLKNMKGKSTWESLEFTAAEIKEAKAIATDVINILSCLCKANG